MINHTASLLILYRIFNLNYIKTEENKKKDIILLGDGFFARGFLHNINYNIYNVTQIYKDGFINPQDIIYNLENDIDVNNKPFHFRDLLYRGPNTKIQQTITQLDIIDNNNININNNKYNFDYLVIGLGSMKTLATWKDEINNIKKNNIIDIIGMGPVGLELSNILSKKYKINMFDILPKDKVMGYVSPLNKDFLLKLLEKKNISTTYNTLYNVEQRSRLYPNNYKIFCVGNKPNILTNNMTVNNFLQYRDNIYIGGDCANYEKLNYIRTAQVAYMQGEYVAKRLNSIHNSDNIDDLNKPFEYKPNGISLQLGDKKVLIEGHNIIPDYVYPDILIKLYSAFFI
jgi:NADH dehydrogenase FAD-containing subunit